MQIDWPIGTDEERAVATDRLPGNWFDANPYLNLYEINQTEHIWNYHTGADLNLNSPSWNSDNHKPILAIADGTVTFAGLGGGTWGHIIVIQHLIDGKTVYSRSAHVEKWLVKTGDTVKMGQQIASVGSGDGAYVGHEHFHFDISTTSRLATYPNDWPGKDKSRVERDYVSPISFIVQTKKNVDPMPTPVTRIDNIVDLSHHNTVPDPVALAASVSGIIHKATQGRDFVDSAYETRKAQFKSVLWGAYHFGVAGNPVGQARHFIDIVKPDGRTLLALDYEGNPDKTQGTMTVTEAEQFATEVHRLTGVWPVIYLRASMAPAESAILSNCPLWVASYRESPSLPKLWGKCILHQYNNGASGPAPYKTAGITCDHNRFYGTSGELATFWKSASGSISGPDPVPVPVPIPAPVHVGKWGINLDPRSPAGAPPTATLRGLSYVRFVFKVDSEKNTLDQAFAVYDPIISAFAAQGTRVLLIINQETVAQDLPIWFSKTWAQYIQTYAAVLGKISARYKGKVYAYEIWNEGDVAASTSVYIEPSVFGTMLRTSVTTVKSNDPSALVVSGGLVTGDPVAYLKKAGQLTVDGIGLHPYGKIVQTTPPGGSTGSLATAIAAMATFNLPVWITEIGVARIDPNNQSYWTGIAQYEKEVYDLCSKTSLVKAVIWFGWSDLMDNAGIVNVAQSPKGAIYTNFMNIMKADGSPVVIPPAPTDNYSETLYVSTASTLRLRATPSTIGALIGALERGDSVKATPTDKVESGDYLWRKVQSPKLNATGWMAQSVLSTKEMYLTSTPPSSSGGSLPTTPPPQKTKKSKISFHILPGANIGMILDILRSAQSASKPISGVLLVKAGWGGELTVSGVKSVSPSTEVMYRHWNEGWEQVTNQVDWAKPDLKSAGYTMVKSYFDAFIATDPDAKLADFHQFINEPSYGAGTASFWDGALNAARDLKIKLAVGCFPVGNPPLPNEPGGKVFWDAMYPVLRRVRDEGHAFMLHQYIVPDPSGPWNEVWCILRHHQLYSMFPDDLKTLPVRFGEFGTAYADSSYSTNDLVAGLATADNLMRDDTVLWAACWSAGSFGGAWKFSQLERHMGSIKSYLVNWS